MDMQVSEFFVCVFYQYYPICHVVPTKHDDGLVI